MNILDENVFASQRILLSRWRIRVRHVGHDIGHQGLADEGIIPLLHQLHRPTLFTRDVDFFRREWRHERYCLVWLNVRPLEVAEYVRRVLRHPELNTQAKRLGFVMAVAPDGLRLWRLHAERETRIHWND